MAPQCDVEMNTYCANQITYLMAQRLHSGFVFMSYRSLLLSMPFLQKINHFFPAIFNVAVYKHDVYWTISTIVNH